MENSSWINVDFGIGWYEVEKNDLFITLLKQECIARGLSFRVFTANQLEKAIKKVKNGTLQIGLYLDMASNVYDSNDYYAKFSYHLKDSGTYVVDDPDEVRSAANKSITHFKLLNAKILVPYTIVIRHWDPNLRLSEEKKSKLGSPFVIKPALGYGQKGVKIISSKRPLKKISDARLFDPGDNFLLQEFITPMDIKGRPGWFRVYYLFGELIPCWWNPRNGEYYSVKISEFYNYNLFPLLQIVLQIASIVKIDWFSCEIAISSKDSKFYTIDYMNDQCAVYPKSQHTSGVPDEVVKKIAERIAEKAWLYKKRAIDTDFTTVWFMN